MNKIIALSIFIIISLFCKAQDFSYNKYKLKYFGVVFIPIGLDTLSQDLAKNEILLGALERIGNLNQANLKNKYNVDVTKSQIENASKESYLFWPSHTILNILNSNNWSFDKDSIPTFDDSKIDFIPNISLRRIPSKAHSSFFKQYYFDTKTSADKFTKMIQDMQTETLQQIFHEAKITNSSSEHFLLNNQFPVVGASVEIKIPFDDEKFMNFKLSNYMVYKNNFMYSLKFEFKAEDAQKWQNYIFSILRNSIYF
jgi:hypothetical protein